ncbi:hypothetical protein WSM22_43660 [Cytophagales bacterium WSM2-2]|nr:hypothetical protein WSM22_43660 [Cytophagales bacterium WSM2-2]
MKAHVFSSLNQLPLIITNYHQVNLGVYLRGEKSKRYYTNYFNFQKSVIGDLIDRWKVDRILKNTRVVEEPLLQLSDDKTSTYFFSKIPHWSDYFNQLKNNRMLVLDLFWQVLSEEIKKRLSTLKVPTIGVHVRMGDFKKLAAGQDFKETGGTRTPMDYFISTIQSIRKIHGTSLPVSVFSDGYKNELSELLSLDNIQLVEGNNDMIDLLLLSKSKIIVTSAASTFGYWAGFLSQAPIIMHPDHIHEPLRVDCEIYEGALRGFKSAGN